MRAYVLAAGYGTRLGAAGQDTPKALLRVGGAPVLTHLVDRLTLVAALDEIVLVTNRRFLARFEEWAERSSERWSQSMRILDDGTTSADERLGAVRDLALALLEVPPVGPFLVTAADFIPLFDIARLADAFRTGRSLIALRRARDEGPGRHCEVTLGEDDRVERLREKPSEGNLTGVAAICLYFFEPRVAGLLDEYLAEGGEPDAPGHFVSWLVERAWVSGAFIDGEWLDIGDPEALERARARLAG